MVKNEILRKVAEVHKLDEARIRRNINKYIREGRVLYCILQGRLSLNLGLLVLFLSTETDLPALSAADFCVEMQELEEKMLSRPIDLKE